MRPEEPMSTDERVVRAAYTSAHGQLQETPDPTVRATVLAAASRAVRSRPGAAGRPVRRARWPMSMAALLVVSVLTGLVASQALRDDPDRVLSTTASLPPTPSPTPSALPPPPPAAEVAPTVQPERAGDATTMAPTIAKNRGDARRSPVAPLPAAVARANTAKPQPPADAAPKAQVTDTTASPAPDADAGPATRARATATVTSSAVRSERESRVAAAPAASEPALAQPSTSLRAPAPASAVPPPPMAAPAQALAAKRETAAASASPPSGPVDARHGRAGVEPESPEAWVERIVAMRAAGNELEADREVDALRRRYPEFVIPATALGVAKNAR